jgi:Zn-dependent protease
MEMSANIIIFQIIVLVFSAIIHEFMHGWMADQLGDPTAKNSGRLTLNPIPHIDPVGSLLLPLLQSFILVATGAGIVFGWAKPVPYNPYNLRDQKWGPAKVAAAGPAANLITAAFFGLLLRFLPVASPELVMLFQIIVLINLLLMVFNLVPIPPLDGSKVIMPFLPLNWQIKYMRLEQYGMLLVILFIIVGLPVIFPIINLLFRLIAGV